MVINVKEIELEHITSKELNELREQQKVTYFKSSGRPVVVSNDMLVKVNTNVGVSEATQKRDVLSLVSEISALPYSPDIMMDLTNIELPIPLWEDMLKVFEGPIGILPHYVLYNTDKGLNKTQLLEKIDEIGEKGVSFITIHPTTNRHIHQIASNERLIASTSRGGSIIYKDMIQNNREENIFEELYDDILNLLKNYKMVVSIGTTYRPSNNIEALDRAHLLELERQKEFIRRAKENGNQVIMEGIGHLSLDKLAQYMSKVNELGISLMPLGPMLSDATIGFDHVTSAIGASFASYYGCANIINSVTRDEHTGGVPSKDSIIEGLKTARVAARCVNVTRVEKIKELEMLISRNRQEKKTCVVNGGLFQYTKNQSIESGCDRCKHECPLEILSV